MARRRICQERSVPRHATASSLRADVLRRALEAERLRNARRLGVLRFIAVSAFLGLSLFLGGALGIDYWARAA